MWITATDSGKPADVYDPNGGRPRFAVLFLHDLDQQTLPASHAFTAALERHGAGLRGPAWQALLVGGPRLCRVRPRGHA